MIAAGVLDGRAVVEIADAREHENGHVAFQLQQVRDVLVRQHHLDLAPATGNGVAGQILQQSVERLFGQVCLQDAGAARIRHMAEGEIDWFAVSAAHPLDDDHRCAGRDLQGCGDWRWRRNHLLTQDPVRHLETLRHHVLIEAGQFLHQRFVDLGLGHETPLPLAAVNAPFYLELLQGLADDGTAHVVGAAQLGLTGQQGAGLPDSVIDLGAQNLFQLRVEWREAGTIDECGGSGVAVHADPRTRLKLVMTRIQVVYHQMTGSASLSAPAVFCEKTGESRTASGPLAAGCRRSRLPAHYGRMHQMLSEVLDTVSKLRYHSIKHVMTG